MMRHSLVPIIVFVIALVYVALGATGPGTGDSARVSLPGGLSAPIVTASFVIVWGVLATRAWFARPRIADRSAPISTSGWLAWSGWLAYVGVATISFLRHARHSAPTGQAWGYLLAWLAFPLLAHYIGRRIPLGRRGDDHWVAATCGLAVMALSSQHGLGCVPANINLTAMLLVPGFILALHRALVDGDARRALCALLIVAALAADERRTALVTCGIGSVLVAASVHHQRRWWAVTASIAAAMTIVVIIGQFFWSEAAQLGDHFDRLWHAYDRTRGGSDLRRAQLTHQALAAFREAPCFGVGFGRYLQHLDQLGVDSFHRARPHNLLLITLAETGIVGALALTLMLSLPLVRAWSLAPGDTRVRAWVIAYVCACIYLLGNDYVHSPGFWPVLAALIAATYETGPKPGPKPRSRAPCTALPNPPHFN